MQIPLHIAPMEGMTTFPSRVFLNMTSRPDGATAPFLRVTKTYPERELPEMFVPEITALKGHFPYVIVPQFMACDADNFLRACDLLPPEKAPIIELNCGCPSPNAAGRTAGSGILAHPDMFRSTVEHLISGLGPNRLAVKMRIGINDAAEFPRLIEAVADLPLARLSVHGRTRKERYSGSSRWHLIQAAAERSASITFGSGDVFNRERLSDATTAAPRVQGIYIGRGLLHNPWLIDELKGDPAERLTATTLVHALVCAGILNELSLTKPGKLIRLIGERRIAHFCGRDEQKWEAAAVNLMKAAGIAPSVISREFPVPSVELSPTAFTRIRIMWSYMRTSLTDDIQLARIARAKTMNELSSALIAQSRLAIKNGSGVKN